MQREASGLFDRGSSFETKYTVVKHRQKHQKESEMFEIYEVIIRETEYQFSPTEYFATYLSKQLILVSPQETELFRSNSVELLPLLGNNGNVQGLLMMEIQ